MGEKDLEFEICRVLHRGQSERSVLKTLVLRNSTSDAASAWDLIGAHRYTVFEDTSEWNPYPELMVDLTGGMTPDIVIRSGENGHENRIYIEVKETRKLSYGDVDSQAVRYFLHLLATTRKKPASIDIRRALLLAAPAAWFEREQTVKAWRYFLQTYKGLATVFDITLGEIHTDTMESR
jgi:hypothetical protein